MTLGDKGKSYSRTENMIGIPEDVIIIAVQEINTEVAEVFEDLDALLWKKVVFQVGGHAQTKRDPEREIIKQ